MPVTGSGTEHRILPLSALNDYPPPHLSVHCTVIWGGYTGLIYNVSTYMITSNTIHVHDTRGSSVMAASHVTPHTPP